MAIERGIDELDAFIATVDGAAIRTAKAPWLADKERDTLKSPNFVELSKLIPAQQDLIPRPAIKGVWRHLGMPPEAASIKGETNTHENPYEAYFAGWIGDADRGNPFTYLRLSLADELEGLRMSWQAKTSDGGMTGWMPSGGEIDISTRQAYITHIAVKFEGFLARYYDIEYCVRAGDNDRRDR